MYIDKEFLDSLCMNCMHPKDGSYICNRCGFDERKRQGGIYLPLRTVVGGKYAVGRFLGANGDGATYLGYDLKQNSEIIIREFLPEILISRAPDYTVAPLKGCEANFDDCYAEFLNMWRGIARMRELTGIMTIYDIVEDFGTVYVISEYIETITLRDYLAAQPEGRLPWEEVKKLFMPILSTLSELHKAGIVHGCISPNSLRIGKDGRLRIFQFSITEVRTVGEVLPTAISPGFAALEQYSQSDTIGPWSDVYSFSAVLYRTLTGNVLAEAPQRLNDETINIPDAVRRTTPVYVIDAIWNGLRVNPKIRTKNLTTLHDGLYGVKARINEAVEEEPHKHAYTEDEPEEKKSHGGVIALVIVLILLAATSALALTVFKDKTYSLLGIEQSTSPAEYTTSEEMVRVPDFVNSNLTQEQIKSNVIYNQNFYIVFEEGTDIHADINHIYKQSVPAGESVNKGTQIVLDVCVGRPNVTLPDVVGMNKEDAVKALENLGFKVTIATVENDGTKPTGLVSQMSKDPGLTYEYGEDVVISVYDAPAN